MNLVTANCNSPVRAAESGPAAALATVLPVQVGSGRIQRDLQDRKGPALLYPAQNNADGGCVPAGCLEQFEEVAIGFTLNVSFTYDDENNVVGATITGQIDLDAAFAGPSPPATSLHRVTLPGANPAADLLGHLDLNLRSLTAQELNALSVATGQVPNGRVRAALRTAILEEQQRRAEELRKKVRENPILRLRPQLELEK